jgi:Mor family transcriptional regulator
MTAKQITRNNQIIQDYNAGATLVSMRDYYKISIPRIYAILRHNKITKRKSNNEYTNKRKNLG